MSDANPPLSIPTMPSAPVTSRTVRWRTRALAVVAAMAAALTVWVTAHLLLGVDLKILMSGGTQTMQVGWGSVLVVSLIASLIAWGLLAVLERFIVRARTTWTVIALAILLLSFAGPLFGAGDASAGAKVSLALMHVAVAAVLIPLLARTSPSQSGMARSEQTGR